jgi:hypothetical protein
MRYTVINKSTGVLTIQSSTAVALGTLSAGFSMELTAMANLPTTSANWRTVTYAATSSGGQVLTSGDTLASLTRSTSNTIGVGTIELGDAGDTTLSRSAAGTLAVEGNTVETRNFKNVANGYCGLDPNGSVAASQLPSYVDDVLEYADLAGFPATGTTGKIFVAIDTGKVYRWSGTVYIEISPSPGSTDGVTEGSTNLYFTNARASAAAPVQSVAGRTGAVSVTATDVGLGNVDNTSNATERAATATLTNKRITQRVNTVASSATPSINTDTTDLFTITALAANITSMTSGLTGTPTDGQRLLIRIKDNGTARTIAWGASFLSSGVATLLATTVANKTHTVGLVWDSAVSDWVCVAVDAVGY